MEYVPFRWDQYEWHEEEEPESHEQEHSVAPPRYYHTAVVVGRLLYVFGGTTGSSINSPFTNMMALDCETMKWQNIDAEGPAPYNRSSATACALGEKHFVVFGGYPYYQNSPNTIFTFDTEQNKWRLHECLGAPPPRRANCCPAYNKDKIYYTAASIHFLRISDIYNKPSHSSASTSMKSLYSHVEASIQQFNDRRKKRYSDKKHLSDQQKWFYYNQNYDTNENYDQVIDQNQSAINSERRNVTNINLRDNDTENNDNNNHDEEINMGPFRWHYVRCRGRGAVQTASHDAAVYVPSKDIIISISNYSFTQSVCYFDFKDHLWKAASCNMYNPYPIHSHCISNIGDYVVLFGGYSRNGRSNETWILNTNNWRWTEFRHINDINTSKTSAIVNGELYKTHTWRGSSQSPAALASSDALLPNSENGDNNNNNNNSNLISLENERCPEEYQDDSVYGTINVKFTRSGKAPPYRWGHSMSVYDDNKVVVFGGYDGRQFANDVWVFSTEYQPCSCSSFRSDIKEMFLTE